MTDALIHRLQQDDPEDDVLICINFLDFRNQNQVVAVAQALRGNENAKEFRFEFGRDDDDERSNIDEEGEDFPLNWEVLLHELETREKLAFARICFTPTGHLPPLFRGPFFQTLQQNSNIQKFELFQIEFSNNMMEGIVSFLDFAPSLTGLFLHKCTTSANNRDAARNFAAAVSRNNRIQTLDLYDHRDKRFCCPIFQSLASSNSASRLKTLVFYEPDEVGAGEENESTMEALQHYLESANATIQCCTLTNYGFNQDSGTSHIVRGLSRNTSVTELVSRRSRSATCQAFSNHEWPGNIAHRELQFLLF